MNDHGRSSPHFVGILGFILAALSMLATLSMHTAAAAPADDAACQAVLDAFARLANTPNHQVTVQRDRSGTTMVESINTGTRLYVRGRGTWTSKPFSPAAEIMAESAHAKSQKSSCRRGRDETVEGIEASLYSVHTSTDEGTSDAKLWIAKANGLPVRQEIKLDLAKVPGKTHIEVRFIYAGVAAPVDTH